MWKFISPTNPFTNWLLNCQFLWHLSCIEFKIWKIQKKNRRFENATDSNVLQKCDEFKCSSVKWEVTIQMSSWNKMWRIDCIWYNILSKGKLRKVYKKLWHAYIERHSTACVATATHTRTHMHKPLIRSYYWSISIYKRNESLSPWFSRHWNSIRYAQTTRTPSSANTLCRLICTDIEMNFTAKKCSPAMVEN